MHSLREEKALVPCPRGNLPGLCAAVLATLAIVATMFLFPERSCGLVAMVVLILTLGPLLHGTCLLGEEMYHSTTRYRGQGLGCIVPACGVVGKTLLAALLAGLILLVSGGPPPDQQSWVLLMLASAIYPLFKLLGVLGPSEVEVSEICEARKMNVAHGLAWSFYLGYLKLVLPRLEDSISRFCTTHKAAAFHSRASRKLLILIPLNANIAHKLDEEDENITFYDELPNAQLDRAGVRGRVYKHSVYSILDESGQVQKCVVEYATPLLTLYNMSQESSAGFGEQERRQQVLLFYRTLQDVLDRSLECRDRCRLILISDEHQEAPHSLSQTILRHLYQQQREEFCLTPPPHQESKHPLANPVAAKEPAQHKWQHQPMTREPTLMFSMEAPRTLREPIECSD